MPGDPSHASGPWTLMLPLALVALVIVRNLRPRKLRVEQLWVMPAVFLALTGVVAFAQPPAAPAVIAMEAVAFVAGAVIGWWRGRFTAISVDPETHALTSRTSPVGMALILVVFAARYALRSFGAETAGALHVPLVAITTALLLLAVGLVCVQRLEMAIRANRLLTVARAGA